MPKKYRSRNAAGGYQSGYESEEGTEYYDVVPPRWLGVGTYSAARRFVSRSGKSMVVLSPCDPRAVNFAEAQTKAYFFKLFYPSRVHLITTKETYRLVLPLVHGEPYENFAQTALSKADQIKIIFSAIRALKRVHARGIIYGDVKEDNIYYNHNTGTSEFVDGGSLVKKGTPMPSKFRQNTPVKVVAKRKKHSYLPPEIWSLWPEIVIANASIDVFSLASMLLRVFIPLDPRLMLLVRECRRERPEDRPTLEELEIYLYAMQTIDYFTQEIARLPVNFSHTFSSEAIKKHINLLLSNRDYLLSHPELIAAYRTLRMKSDRTLEEVVRDKRCEIDWRACERTQKIAPVQTIISDVVKAITNLIVDFSDQTTKEAIDDHRGTLIRDLINLPTTEGLISAYHELSLKQHPAPIGMAMYEKHQQIVQGAKEQSIFLKSKSTIGFFSSPREKPTSSEGPTDLLTFGIV